MFLIGGELAQSRLGLPNALTGVFQGLLLFFAARLRHADPLSGALAHRSAPDGGGAHERARAPHRRDARRGTPLALAGAGAAHQREAPAS